MPTCSLWIKLGSCAECCLTGCPVEHETMQVAGLCMSAIMFTLSMVKPHSIKVSIACAQLIAAVLVTAMHVCTLTALKHSYTVQSSLQSHSASQLHRINPFARPGESQATSNAAPPPTAPLVTPLRPPTSRSVTHQQRPMPQEAGQEAAVQFPASSAANGDQGNQGPVGQAAEAGELDGSAELQSRVPPVGTEGNLQPPLAGELL